MWCPIVRLNTLGLVVKWRHFYPFWRSWNFSKRRGWHFCSSYQTPLNLIIHHIKIIPFYSDCHFSGFGFWEAPGWKGGHFTLELNQTLAHTWIIGVFSHWRWSHWLARVSRMNNHARGSQVSANKKSSTSSRWYISQACVGWSKKSVFLNKERDRRLATH